MLIVKDNTKVDSLPVSFVERYRTADGPALKVAVYLMLGNSSEVATIADELSLPIPTVERSLHFWLRAGLLEENATDESEVPEKKKPAISVRQMSTTDFNRLMRNPEVSTLLQETQTYLGRTLTASESQRLIGIYEYEELPVDVILMIIAYCKKRTTRNLISYIERIARIWKEDEIDTLEKAEKHLKLIEIRERRYPVIAEIFETEESKLSFKDKQRIDSWYEELGYDNTFAMEAYERSSTKTIAYINKVLQSWSAKGYVTIKETRMEITNTAAPTPQRRSKKKEDDLFSRAIAETNR